MRVKIATGILVLIGLVSIYQPLNFEKLRVSPEMKSWSSWTGPTA